ncbi:MAG: hypothetical protein Kow0075_08520 [Salibacteraceae bacterium]
MHADAAHLIVNMYVLYTFGSAVEHNFELLFGPLWAAYFLVLYVGGMFLSALPGFIRHRNNYNYHGVGASGAVSAVVFSFILMQPDTNLTLIFLPFFSLPAIVFGLLYLGLEIYLDKNKRSPIAHSAHYVGGIFGLVYTAALEPKLLILLWEWIQSF